MNESCSTPFCTEWATDRVRLETIEYYVCRAHAAELYERLRNSKTPAVWLRGAS